MVWRYEVQHCGGDESNKDQWYTEFIDKSENYAVSSARNSVISGRNGFNDRRVVDLETGKVIYTVSKNKTPNITETYS